MRSKLAFLIVFLLPILMFAQNISGKIVDELGNPIPDVLVKVKKISVQTSTNEQGEFKIFAPIGKIIVFKKKGWKGKSFTINKKQAEPYDITLKQKLSVQKNLLVKGKVLDWENGEPLIGASVLIEGTNKGLVTNIEGQFELTVPKGTVLLIGYGHYEGPTSYIIEKAGYQEFTPNKPLDPFSKSSTQVSINQANFNQGNIHHPLQLIQGKVPGLMNSMGGGNNPFGQFHTRLRGLSSFNGESIYNPNINTAEPLIVVNGIPTADISLLDPMSITAFNVLKDGTAALYGIRGASGVIEITTNQAQQSGIQYQTYIGLDKRWQTMQLLTASTYPKTRGADDLGESTDWYEEVSRTAISQTHQLTLSNTIKNTNYSIRLTYRNANGILKNQGFDRLQLNAFLSQSAFKERLKMTVNIRGTNQDNNFSSPSAFRYAQVYNPTAPIFEEGNDFDDFYQKSLFDYYNPVAILNQHEHRGKQSIFSSQIAADLEITPNLYLSTTYATEYQKNWSGEYISKYSFWRSGTFRNGWANQTEIIGNNQFYDAHLTFQPNLYAIKSQIKIGYQSQIFNQNYLSVEGRDFLTDAFSYNNLAASNDFANGLGRANSNKSKHQLAAYYAQAQLNWKNAILINSGLRLEGSSRLGKDVGFGRFPFVAMDVHLDKLTYGFLRENQVRLRGSMGISGNLPFDNYLSQKIYQKRYQYFYNNGEYNRYYDLVLDENRNLKWEEKKEWNLGFNANSILFGKSLKFTFNIYQSQISDIIRPRLINDLGREYNGNIGALKNSGAEMSLAIPFIEKNNFSWNSNFLFSNNKTILTKYTDDPKSNRTRFPATVAGGGCCKVSSVLLEKGSEIGTLWLLQAEGIDANGQWIFEDVDGDGVRDDVHDKTNVGNGLPDWIIGWNNEITYGNFHLNLFFRGAIGHDNFNITRKLTENPGQLHSYNILNTTFEGESARLTDQPQESSFYVENASFLRLDNATLSYDIPIEKSKLFNQFRVYIAAQNVFTISGYSGWDSDYYLQANGDVFAAGYEFRNTYLPTKSFVFGLKMGMF